jgi:hypothetical protein
MHRYWLGDVEAALHPHPTLLGGSGAAHGLPQLTGAPSGALFGPTASGGSFAGSGSASPGPGSYGACNGADGANGNGHA